MKARLLLCDDDDKLRGVLTEYLVQNGFLVEAAERGSVALGKLERESYDVVLLDVMMPGDDGLTVLGKIRKLGRVPVIMLTAKGDETDRVVGLELGADDYVSKPFSPRELLARIRAVLRRTGAAIDDPIVRAGGLVLDLGARTAEDEGHVLELTGLEFDLLAALVRKQGRVVPRDRLLAEAGRESTVVSERTVDVHISHLRSKLGDDPRSPTRIKTVRGVGYVFARGEG